MRIAYEGKKKLIWPGRINITIQLTVSLIFTKKYWPHISKQLACRAVNKILKNYQFTH